MNQIFSFTYNNLIFYKIHFLFYKPNFSSQNVDKVDQNSINDRIFRVSQLEFFSSKHYGEAPVAGSCSGRSRTGTCGRWNPPGSNWTSAAELWVKSLPGLADPSSTCTHEDRKHGDAERCWRGDVRRRMAAAYLDGNVCRVGAPPAASDLDLKRPGRLAGSVAGRRQLDPRPEQLQPVPARQNASD